MFSNFHFYEKQLIIPPSCDRSDESGVNWHFCSDGRFSGGTNSVEAGVVVNLLVNHIVENSCRPIVEQESVGVVAMNMDQQAVIEDELERLRAADNAFEEAFQQFQPEQKLFIRNLENVQGDERDVIIISFTYGPDPVSNKVFRRFGPINTAGGWRRLNVLFTRARRRIDAVSSMRYTDITGGTGDTGVPALRNYLEYAETGKITDFGEGTDRVADSPFEESVAGIICRFGLQPVFQVGVAGFRIDIGVEDPENPGKYLCGIECDGAPYHTDPVTRDRDRLREEILVARGWKIYRIWSTAWYRNRQTEIERLQKYLASIVPPITERNNGSAKRTPTDVTPSAPPLVHPPIAEEVEALQPPPEKQVIANLKPTLEIGDTVIYYENSDETHVEIQITSSPSRVEYGIINASTPIARSLLGRTEGEKVSVHLPDGTTAITIEKILKRAF